MFIAGFATMVMTWQSLCALRKPAKLAYSWQCFTNKLFRVSVAILAEVGLQTFVDLLEFVGSLILSEGEGIHLGLDIFGLGLLQAALNSGAQALARYAATQPMETYLKNLLFVSQRAAAHIACLRTAAPTQSEALLKALCWLRTGLGTPLTCD